MGEVNRRLEGVHIESFRLFVCVGLVLKTGGPFGAQTVGDALFPRLPPRATDRRPLRGDRAISLMKPIHPPNRPFVRPTAHSSRIRPLRPSQMPIRTVNLPLRPSRAPVCTFLLRGVLGCCIIETCCAESARRVRRRVAVMLLPISGVA